MALVGVALFLLISLLTYHPDDPNRLLENFPLRSNPANECGGLGATLPYSEDAMLGWWRGLPKD